jgi:hypothetical protein
MVSLFCCGESMWSRCVVGCHSVWLALEGVCHTLNRVTLGCGGYKPEPQTPPHLEQKEKTEKKKNATRNIYLRSEQC